MNDRAEQAFRDAFRDHADGEQPVPFTVASAPSRGPRWRWLAAAALVLAVVMVPWWLVARNAGTQDHADAAPSATPSPLSAQESKDPLSGLEPAAEGWKWVSRGKIAVQVPENWAYSGYSWAPWCVGDDPKGPPEPYVDSPMGPVAAIACGPFKAEWVGLHLAWGTIMGMDQGHGLTESVTRKLAGESVSVVLPLKPTAEERALAERVVESAVAFERDESGCAPVSRATELKDRPDPWDIATAEGVTAAGICRYQLSASVGSLEGSRRLDGKAAADLVKAIADAPVGEDGNPADCLEGYDEGVGAVIRVATRDGVREVYLRVDGCRHLGFDDGTTRRKLTQAACRPLFEKEPISLGSGAIDVYDACFTEGSR